MSGLTMTWGDGRRVTGDGRYGGDKTGGAWIGPGSLSVAGRDGGWVIGKRLVLSDVGGELA
jgi:hypothetical protein